MYPNTRGGGEGGHTPRTLSFWIFEEKVDDKRTKENISTTHYSGVLYVAPSLNSYGIRE